MRKGEQRTNRGVVASRAPAFLRYPPDDDQKGIEVITIIDGNNLLWAMHQSFEEREITNEIELCRVLSQYFSHIARCLLQQ